MLSFGPIGSLHRPDGPVPGRELGLALARQFWTRIVVYSRPNTQSAFWFDISGLSFKPVNDVGPLMDYHAADLLMRALVVWVVTTILGGTGLAVQISFVARMFHAPEFAELQPMGFVMAAVLGLGLAISVMIRSLREAYLDC